MAPPPELSWRTRRETRLTRTLGLPTFSNAFFVNSAFNTFSWLSRAGYLNCSLLKRNLKIGAQMCFGAGVYAGRKAPAHACPAMEEAG